MRNSLLLALGGTLLTNHASALKLRDPSPGQSARVVQHDIKRRTIADPVAHDRARLARRSGTVSVNLANEETLYYMDVSVGTPAQALELHIDTGSSDLWVNTPSSNLCSEGGNPCAASGTYSPKKSSTYKYINSDFNITYEDGSGATGDYISDTVAFGSVTLKAQELGIGLTSTSRQGIIGIGYANNEASIEYDHGVTYANVPASLVSAGYISVNAYSLWLNDLDASTGSILFGGVDTDKYTGTLETVPIIPLDGSDYAEFLVALTAVGANGQNGSIASNIAVEALLDSGTSLLYLPNEIAEAIFQSLGATYDENEGTATVDCSLGNSNTTLDFTFSSPTISVALSELVLISGGTNINPICILGVAPSGSNSAVLGDTFLRSAYVVYDLADNEISLAQTDFGATSSNIKEITKSGVPGASTVTNAVTSGSALQSGVAVAQSSIAKAGAARAVATPAPVWRAGAVVGAVVGAGALFAL